MLKARAPAGGAAPIAAVEAELGRGVAALPGQRCGGKQLADAVPRAHVAHGVGARRLADGRLVHKHHIGQVVRAQQAVVRAGGFGGLAKVAHQRGASTSWIRLDLPEPLTPVTVTSRCSEISTDTSLRLCCARLPG